MMYAISITKWSAFTEHYYAKIYRFKGNYTSAIISGFLTLDNAEDMSKEYPDLYPVIKDEVERTVINKAANMLLDESSLSKFICVFYEYKYSASRTFCIENHKAIKILPELEPK